MYILYCSRLLSELWSGIIQRAVTEACCIYASVLFLSGYVSPTYFQIVLVQVPLEISDQLLGTEGQAFKTFTALDRTFTRL